jgi:hypothetical protein
MKNQYRILLLALVAGALSSCAAPCQHQYGGGHGGSYGHPPMRPPVMRRSAPPMRAYAGSSAGCEHGTHQMVRPRPQAPPVSAFAGGTVWHECHTLGKRIPFENVRAGAVSVRCRACGESVRCVAGPAPISHPEQRCAHQTSPALGSSSRVCPDCGRSDCPDLQNSSRGTNADERAYVSNQSLYHSTGTDRSSREPTIQNNGTTTWNGHSPVVVLPEIKWGNSQ